MDTIVKKEELRRYFASWDPMRFIAEDGAPIDEYDEESDIIFERIKKMADPDLKKIATLIHKTLVDFIEIDPTWLKHECIENSRNVHKIVLS